MKVSASEVCTVLFSQELTGRRAEGEKDDFTSDDLWALENIGA